MQRWLSITLIFLLAACTQAPIQQTPIETQANYWQQLGNAINVQPSASIPRSSSLGLDAAGNPVVSWQEFNSTTNISSIYVKRWDGSNWVPLGGAINVDLTRDAYYPSLAVNSLGNPIVAFMQCVDGIEGCSNYNIYVKRWNGASWQPLGSHLDLVESESTNYPSLALDSSGNPAVSWEELGNVYVKHWNGANWQPLGSALDVNPTLGAGLPSLAIDWSNNPVVTWLENDGFENKIYVKRWNGANWEPLGTELGVSGNYLSIAINGSGNPVVAWQQCIEFHELGFCSASDISIRSWSGTSWTLLPGVSGYNPSLKVNTFGNLVLGWHNCVSVSSGGLCTNVNTFVSRLNVSTWIPFGTAVDVNLSSFARYPSLALDGSGNPVVSWEEAAGVYVKRFISNAWQPLGDELDFTTALDSTNSVIARKSNNLPVVAWSEVDATNGSRNIHVKEWTGSAWNKVGSGPLDRNVLRNALNPSIAMRSDNQPVVAWHEANNVYVKRWSGTTWANIGGALDTVLTDAAFHPSIALDTVNLPVVAYMENGDIRVKKASGVLGTSTWLSSFGTTPLDQSALNTAYAPKLALKSDNNPIVAWYEDSGTSLDIHVKEWKGDEWNILGTVIETNIANNARDIALAIGSDNRPVVAWGEEGNVRVKRWDGSAWIPLGGVIDKVAANDASIPAIDLRTDDNPVVSWQEWNGTSYDVWVKRWNGTRWVLVSTTSVDKVSTQSAGSPSIVLKTNNNPFVSWQEFDGVSSNIYVKQF